MGTNIKFKKIVDKDTSSATTAEKEQEAFDRFCAYLYLNNASKDKYASLLRGLQSQRSLDNNQYPTTITKAQQVLSTHNWDNNNKKQKSSNDEKKTNKSNNDEGEIPISSLSFAQMSTRCWICRSTLSELAAM